MTWVRNLFSHPYQPSTGGPSFGPRQEADITISGRDEQEAIAQGFLLVLDPGYVPPPPPPMPLDGQWRAPFETLADLPSDGNQLGDVRLAVADGVAYYWSGTAWIALAGGGGGSTADQVDLVLTGALTAGQVPIWNAGASHFGPGELTHE